MDKRRNVRDVFIHPQALVETENIGEATRIWAFAHVMKDVVIGKDCNIGGHVFIESGVRVGNGVTVKNGVAIWKGVHIADYVFIGPYVVFANDKLPRSPRLPIVKDRYETTSWLTETFLEEGCSLGSNATILNGIRLGKYSMIGAGSVITRDVPHYGLVYGVPGRLKGYVNKKGELLKNIGQHFVNPLTNQKYQLINGNLKEIL